MTGWAMDELMLVGVMMALLVLGGSLMGWLSMLRIKALEQRLRDMEARLARELTAHDAPVMHTPLQEGGVDKSPAEVPPREGLAAADATPPISDSRATASSSGGHSLSYRLLQRLLHGAASSRSGKKGRGADPASKASEVLPGGMSRLLTVLQEHWMILVGALSLVMAGILLVGYSLEQGLLGPGVRLALGLGFGLSMTVLAEWLRLRTSQSSSLTGAVSGAGSLVLAASLLAGHFLLSLVSMPVTFVLLAALSLWMLERARHHGPWLAALGMLGGYALPLALPIHQQWQEASTLLLLGYAGVIAAACRVLYRQVAVSWLYWGGLVGALAWWLLLMPFGISSGATLLVGLLPWVGGVWLAVLALGYLWGEVWEPSTGAAEKDERQSKTSLATWLPWRASLDLRRHWLAGGLVSVSVVLGLWLPWLGSLVHGVSFDSLVAPSDMAGSGVSLWHRGWLASLMPMLVIAWSSRRHAVLWSMVVAGNGLWLLVWGLALTAPLSSSAMISPLILSVGLLSLARWRPRHDAGERAERSLAACWWALATMVPLLAWALMLWQDVMPWTSGASDAGRLINTGLVNTGLPPLIWGLVCWAGAMRFQAREGAQLAAGLWLPAQAGIFLALVAVLEGPSLTLALALQLLGLTACEWRWYREGHTAGRSVFAELSRLLAWGVVARLMYGMAHDDYAGIAHWPLQILLPVLACVAMTSLGMRHRPRTQRWLEGAVVQLAVATLVMEIRYVLTGGKPFEGSLTLAELSLQVLALAGVAASYAWRARSDGAEARAGTQLYRVLALVVGGAAVILWSVGVLGIFNPLWHPGDVGSWPLVNWLLPAYGLPALGAAMLWRMTSRRAPDVDAGSAATRSRIRGLSEVLGLLSAGLWLALNLRHCWHGAGLGLWQGIEQAELYAYSVLMLVVAAALVVSGAKVGQQHWQRIGQGILILTVIKVGVWDTATLEGLWRVGSWLGLGSVLMLLSALFNRLAGAGMRAGERN
ncbi:DUF2339 domain-containing protein [Cobetia sp. D5]|uniref:DUF2339 domain-containing protein n=1 Tax=Cobetia sp. D5 TaxID=3105867 RepID=UPI002D7963E2|nr:DUF2339 domain-containing protein [Cobetia sp. D5]